MNILNFLFIIVFNANAEIVNNIPKGTVLTCPKDNKPIIKIIKDVNLFEEISFSNFELLEEYPPDLEKKIPCEVIKSLCYHINNKWIGFNKECELIPYNSGKFNFKEFIENERTIKKERNSIVNQEFSCSLYNGSKDFSICISKDKKWKCIKSIIYKDDNNIGPCTKND